LFILHRDRSLFLLHQHFFLTCFIISSFSHLKRLKMKKQVYGAVAGGATLFLTGYLIYVIIFNGGPAFVNGDGAASASRSATMYPVIILMEIVYGLLLTFILARQSGASTVMNGVIVGAWIGLLLGTTMGMWSYATTTMITINGIFYYAATFAIRFAIAGGVITWVLSKVKDTPKAAA
jgi:hypothetical protein